MRHILACSGGKDSTALAVYLRPKLPTLEAVLCDTGRELPELYAFVARLEPVTGPITRITDGWHCPGCGATGTDPVWRGPCPKCAAPRKPRDMDYYIERWSTPEDGPYLPSAGARWCTKHLKIRPFERYIGGDLATVYIGFRADEDRPGNYGERPNITYRYPFQEDGIDLRGVMAILEGAGVKLPQFYRWRGVGGCWNCPFQRPKHWLGLSRNHPELFARAVEEESRSAFKYRRKPLPQVVRAAEAGEGQGELWDDGDALDGACAICSK